MDNRNLHQDMELARAGSLPNPTIDGIVLCMPSVEGSIKTIDSVLCPGRENDIEFFSEDQLIRGARLADLIPVSVA
jgi:hypothetical protein